VSDRLDLRGRGLSTVPGEVWQARGLRSLALGRNPLGAIPDAIGALTSLTALYLDQTGIEALPEALGRLQALRSLDLRETAIAVLPDWLAELPALQRLDLRWNGLLGPPPVVRRLRRVALTTGPRRASADPSAPPRPLTPLGGAVRPPPPGLGRAIRRPSAAPAAHADFPSVAGDGAA
jgi:hypothetical protein